MPLDIAKALVAEGHRAGKPVFAHPSNMEGIEIAVESRVDVLVHTAPSSGPWPPALIKRMKTNRMALIPTLRPVVVAQRVPGTVADPFATIRYWA